jgi:hypothetical protein
MLCAPAVALRQAAKLLPATLAPRRWQDGARQALAGLGASAQGKAIPSRRISPTCLQFSFRNLPKVVDAHHPSVGSLRVDADVPELCPRKLFRCRRQFIAEVMRYGPAREVPNFFAMAPAANSRAQGNLKVLRGTHRMPDPDCSNIVPSHCALASGLLWSETKTRTPSLKTIRPERAEAKRCGTRHTPSALH